MPYVVKRSGHIVETLQLEDHGKRLDLTVDVVIDRILRDFTLWQAAIASAQQKLSDMRKAGAVGEELSAAYTELGAALVALLQTIFGEDQTQQLVDFYDANYMELLRDLMPFMHDVVVPRIQEAREEIEAGYTKWRR